jgi:hypothetical protein
MINIQEIDGLKIAYWVNDEGFIEGRKDLFLSMVLEGTTPSGKNSTMSCVKTLILVRWICLFMAVLKEMVNRMCLSMLSG